MATRKPETGTAVELLRPDGQAVARFVVREDGTVETDDLPRGWGLRMTDPSRFQRSLRGHRKFRIETDYHYVTITRINGEANDDHPPALEKTAPPTQSEPGGPCDRCSPATNGHAPRDAFGGA